MNLATTLGELKATGYRSESVKSEMRRNLISRLRRREPLFPGIVGYDETVIPQVANAVLSQHDMLFLGLRGQGKTRLLRMLVQLLDPMLPIVAGSEINDDPLRPLSKYARDTIARYGDSTPIAWAPREQRYQEKLATPDVTIADLVGEIDLVKHAEGRYLASEDVMHFGLIPRSHRGIFCMNELPDLAPRIQVGLFNVLEERDVQIRGFPVRLDLDVAMVFSANPEDYTHRGRIVTPLKDRIGSVIRTHYPLTRELGMRITDENAWTARDSGVRVHVPRFIKEIVEETSRLARASSHVNQASGVSVRMSIANFETVVSNAERRCVMLGSDATVARVTDLAYLSASSLGKLELALTEDAGDEDKLIGRIVDEAVKTVFDQYFKPQQFKSVIEYVESGKTLDVGDELASSEYVQRLRPVSGFLEICSRAAGELDPGLFAETREDLVASVCEFALEGLYCHNKLNRTRKPGASSYGR